MPGASPAGPPAWGPATLELQPLLFGVRCCVVRCSVHLGTYLCRRQAACPPWSNSAFRASLCLQSNSAFRASLCLRSNSAFQTPICFLPFPSQQEAGNLSILFDVGGVLGGAVAGYLSGGCNALLPALWSAAAACRIPRGRPQLIAAVRYHLQAGLTAAKRAPPPHTCRRVKHLGAGLLLGFPLRQSSLALLTQPHPMPLSNLADVSGASALVSFGFVFSAIPFLYLYRVFGELSFAGALCCG